MKFFILSLLIITITASAVPPSPQYDARAVGAMPCYLGCCKLFDREGFIFSSLSLGSPMLLPYQSIDFFSSSS